MKNIIPYIACIWTFASACGPAKSTSVANESAFSGVTENYTAGEKIYYRLSHDKRVRATVVKKINDSEYLLTIHQNSKGARRKVPISKMEKGSW